MLLQYLQTDHECNIFGRIAANSFFIRRMLSCRLACGRIPGATAATANVCLQTKLSEKVK